MGSGVLANIPAWWNSEQIDSEEEALADLRGFSKRMKWFLENRQDLSQHIAYMTSGHGGNYRLLAIPSRERLQRRAVPRPDSAE